MGTVMQYIGTGRRKNSIARVRLVPGTGQIVVNKRSMEHYFSRESHHLLIHQPFQSTSTGGQYNVYVDVWGGGISGQAGAIRHGIARALLTINADFRGNLRKDGLMTRDSRVKERKKYGQPGARKRFQFSKR